MFINRQEELAYLRSCYNSARFEFIIIYGRRRVGKSRLVLESIKQTSKSVYFLATEENETLLLAHFKATIAQQLMDTGIFDIKDEWEPIFKYLIDIGVNVIIIDEFPYLLSANKAIKSIFQRIIDLYLSKTAISFILLGSSISVMEDEVLSTKSPLYGRRTGQIKLQPILFQYLTEMFPNYSVVDLVHIYAVTGGMPYYLQQFNPAISFWDNIQTILLPHNILFEEVKILLLQEFRQITIYSSILQYIATGTTDFGDIKNKLKSKSDISPYLQNLIQLELIERRVPITENRGKSRLGKYYIKDNYVKFWYNFILKYQEQLIMKVNIIPKLQQEFPQYVGLIFENIVQQLLSVAIYSGQIKLPFEIVQIGPWWHREIEIDLIAMNASHYLFIEIKWQDLTAKDIARIFQKLQEKAKETRLKGTYYYVVVARSVVPTKLSINHYTFELNELLQKVLKLQEK